MEFKEGIEEFLFDCASRGLSNETIKNYGFNLRNFSTFLIEKGIVNVEEIKQNNIKQFSISQNKKGYLESYVNTQLTIVKCFLNYMHQEKYITEKVEVKNIKKRYAVVKTFTDEEIMKMINVSGGNCYIDIRDKCILLMLIDCGLRAGEIIRLRDIDIKDNNTLFIQGKGKRERYVPFSPILKKALLKYERIKKSYFLDRKMTPTYLFISRYGQPITRFIIEDIVRKISEKAGVTQTKVFPHNFRHYYAVKNLKNGLDLYSLSRLMGHSDVSTSAIYTQSIKDQEISELGKKSSPLMNLI